MSDTDGGDRLYLVTPTVFEPEDLACTLAEMLSGGAVACLRLDLGAAPEEDWVRASNHLLPVCHAAEVPLLVTDHYRLVAALGLDGVHLSDTRTPVRSVRKMLGADRIVGAAGGVGRHAAITLAEAGVDYVALGPLHAEGTLGDGQVADDDLFAWWAEMIETPVVAEGGVTPDDVARLRDTADFFVPDRAIWETADPVAALSAYAAALRG